MVGRGPFLFMYPCLYTFILLSVDSFPLFPPEFFRPTMFRSDTPKDTQSMPYHPATDDGQPLAGLHSHTQQQLQTLPTPTKWHQAWNELRKVLIRLLTLSSRRQNKDRKAYTAPPPATYLSYPPDASILCDDLPRSLFLHFPHLRNPSAHQHSLLKILPDQPDIHPTALGEGTLACPRSDDGHIAPLTFLISSSFLNRSIRHQFFLTSATPYSTQKERSVGKTYDRSG